ncbi:hypothetical protein D6827_00650, partial [Candidatus Parcubacteria bacterium]
MVASLPFINVRANDNAIKTANYFLQSGTKLNDESTVKQLALYDVLVLPAEAQVYNPDFPEKIRNFNPDIILLAYVPSVSWNKIWRDSLHKKLYSKIQSSFWLKDKNGTNISIWPGTQALDLTSDWNNVLAEFVADEILNDNYWDGVFYDEVNDGISWVGDVALANPSDNIDQSWIDAYTQLFARTRSLIGDEKIIISNGSSKLQHAPYVNGRMFESFPTPWEDDGSTITNIRNYLTLEQNVNYTPVMIINSDTNNTGDNTNYRRVRLGLSSALLGSGFFGFDFGTESHGQIWRFDEYDAYIGQAKSNPKELENGVWTREFSHGLSLVNPTDSEQTVSLNGEYEKIHGTQDTQVNDGTIVNQVTLPAQDGLILLRPIEKINRGLFLNGAFARIF